MTTSVVTAEETDARRTRRLIKNGKRVGIIGLIVLMIGGAILGTGAFRLFRDISQTRDGLDIEVPVPGRGEVQLEPGTYAVVAIGNRLTQRVGSGTSKSGRLDRAPFTAPTVTITDRKGWPVALAGPRTRVTYSTTSYDLVSMSSFRVVTAGTYVIEVTGEPGPVQSIGVGPSDNIDGGALLMTIGGGALFGLGGLVTIVGIALYVTGRMRRSRNQPSMGSIPGWAPVPGPPGYANSPQAGGYGSGPHSGTPAGGWSPPSSWPAGPDR